jgi:succinate dehydrogenase / fumarate reductase iron-sulfur subunit
MADALLKIFRSDGESGAFHDYTVPLHEGMVVLDAIHHVQAHQQPDLACRWNCKAGRCGSCSAEVNGKPRLMCMTRMDHFPAGEPITVSPMRTFKVIKDLVCDVSWNYAVNKRIRPLKTRPADMPDGTWRMQQIDIDRLQEFRKCIECFLCQDVCHVLRDHEAKEEFIGPRFLVRMAGLEMHPLDTESRTKFLKDEGGIGYCNITKCCTEVCPESIHITDNAIIPLKERVVDDFYDPVRMIWRRLTGG